MALVVDYFISFRSPYTYLSGKRVAELPEQWDLEVKARPVFPIAVRDPDFFKKVNPMWPPYVLRDSTRVAEMMGIPYGWPQPDPIVQDMQTRIIAKEQPYIRRLTYLGIEAARRGKGLEFFRQVSLLLFGGSVEGWDMGDHMKDAAARAGLDLGEMEAAIAGNEEACEAAAAQNLEALHEAGHWGVPTLVFEGEPFFGQDRIEMCLWRMKQRGLKPR
ncbi:MAG: 2-hydroxychromene-2-carboxylate isomerase [Alphaproteobacteria bacterium]